MYACWMTEEDIRRIVRDELSKLIDQNPAGVRSPVASRNDDVEIVEAFMKTLERGEYGGESLYKRFLEWTAPGSARRWTNTRFGLAAASVVVAKRERRKSGVIYVVEGS